VIEIVEGSIYNPAGYYVFENETGLFPVCRNCAPAEIPEEWEPLGYWHEVDSPEHCYECEALIYQTLTPDGVAFVQESIAEGDGRPEILEVWAEMLIRHGL